MEQVTGHTIADFRPILLYGIKAQIAAIDEKLKTEEDDDKIRFMKR